MKFFRSIALIVGCSLATGLSIVGAEAAQKKSRRDNMTEAQKKALRQRARDWCTKNIKGMHSLERVEIKSNGRVVCWYR